MEESCSPPGSPASPSPLMAMSPERFNQQQARNGNDPPESPLFASIIRSSENHNRDSLRSSQQHQRRDSEVTDKIRRFNNLTSGTTMTKQLERNTADAALRRAMLGREEAETEMRRYREEARALRSAVEEGRERERKVGERLETVMVSFCSLRGEILCTHC